MNYKKFLGAASAALMIVIVVTLMTPGAWAQSAYKTLYRFKGGKDGNGPAAGLIFDSAGNMYGTTQNGGAYKAGTVFELSPGSGGGWTESVLYSFMGGADGAVPTGSLIFDTSGNLYGTTALGGTSGTGVVFELVPNSSGEWTENVLYSFAFPPPATGPVGALIFDAAGNLYGTTWNGGSNNCQYGCGVVFKLTPTNNGDWTESVLYAPDGSGLTSFHAGLTMDGAGDLYGATWYGGINGNGGVFELTPNADGSWTEHTLYNFKGDTNGAHPRDRLIFDSAGNLYGTTGNQFTSGYGTVFKLVPNSDGSWTKHTLHQFTGGKDGANPWAGLTFDSAGNLYGTTNDGGASGYGVVFKLTPTSTGGWTFHVLHAFKDAAGAYPEGDLLLDVAGNIYGTTYGDGSKTFGSVFEITP
jgi:uncharacterized repeat protein (TIGR03803 family)